MQITICGHGRIKYTCKDCAEKEAALNAPQPARYSHLFSIGFSLDTNNAADQVTAAELFAAIHRRIADLERDPQEILEACGVPLETTDHQETDVERTTRENIEAITELPTPEQDAADLARQEKIWTRGTGQQQENRATILAALRLFQDTFEDREGEQIRASKYGEYFCEVLPLGTDDIDTLCGEIAFGTATL